MKLDILAFAAHPDDVELSASGTLMKHIAEGKKVGIIDLTQGELGTRGTIESRYDEAAAASQIMGLSFRENLKMKDGFFEISEENKLLIIEQIRRFQPDIILANTLEDRHPDHGRAAKLVADASFLSGLRKIETTWNNIPQNHFRPRIVLHYIQDFYLKPDFVVDVSEFITQKIDSIRAYKSQFYDPNSSEPVTPISGEEFFDFITGRMAQFGRQIGAKYAEGFVCNRTFGIQSFDDLI
jgi:bacillithiol biosynthesis deacetylase BshB1